MEFLYSLYSNQYFALVLFAIIAILLLAFVIVLIAAINDSKKRKLELLNQMEKEDIKEVEEVANAALEPQSLGDVISDLDKTDGFALILDENMNETEEEKDNFFDDVQQDNSMSGLLDEFEEESTTSAANELDELIAQVEREKAVEFTPVEQVRDENVGPDDDFFALTQIDAIKPVEEPVVEENEVQEPVVSVAVEEDEDDDFELPAMKTEDENKDTPNDDFFNLDNDDIPEVKVEDLKNVDLDLEKTGVLNFSNIETESYEIK